MLFRINLSNGKVDFSRLCVKMSVRTLLCDIWQHFSDKEAGYASLKFKRNLRNY